MKGSWLRDFGVLELISPLELFFSGACGWLYFGGGGATWDVVAGAFRALFEGSFRVLLGFRV